MLRSNPTRDNQAKAGESVAQARGFMLRACVFSQLPILLPCHALKNLLASTEFPGGAFGWF